MKLRVNCPICKKSDSVKFFYNLKKDRHLKRRFKYYTCSQCFLAFIHPRLTKYDLRAIYQEEYYIIPSEKIKGSSVIDKIFKIEFNSYEKFVSDLPLVRHKLLDVGCGRGEFLYKMQKKGWDIYGVEPYKEAVIKTQERIGKKRVWQGELPKIKFKNKKFDVITMWHVLEHLDYPSLYLRKIRSLLTKSGFFVLEVPNLDAVNLALFRESYSGLGFAEHVFYFSKKGLKKLLEDNGFKVERIYSPLKMSSNFSVNLANILTEHFRLNWKLVVLSTLPFSFFVAVVGLIFGRGEVIRLVVRK